MDNRKGHRFRLIDSIVAQGFDLNALGNNRLAIGPRAGPQWAQGGGGLAKCRHVALMIASSLVVGSKAKASEFSTSELFTTRESDGIRLVPNAETATLKIENDQYLNYGQPAFRPGAEHTDQNLTLKFEGEEKIAPALKFKLDASDSYHGGERANYVDVFAAEFDYRVGAVKLALGRKLETWSSWDDRWNQGFFQPRYMEDRLHPKAAGLTGLFIDYKNDHSRFTLAALPIFIPDFGPQFQVVDGRFVSPSPWFNPPASQFVYRGAANDIRYSLTAPSTSEVLAHPGAAAKWEYRDENYLSRFSAAIKPLDSFVQGFPSAHPLVVGANGDFVNIEISPRVIYERVLNLDQEFKFGSWSTSMSLAYEDPFADAEPGDWTVQGSSAALIVSGALTHQGEVFSFPLRSEFGFLKISGGDARDTGPFATDQSLFDRRYQFYEAYTFSLATNFSVLSHSLTAKWQALYDRLQNGGVVSFVSGYAFSKGWLASVDIDLMGLFQADAQMPDGFLASYRANSRMGVGVSYVF